MSVRKGLSGDVCHTESYDRPVLLLISALRIYARQLKTSYMASNSEESPESAYERLGATFRTGKTQALSYRLSQLHALEAFVRTNEGEAEQALSSDMGRPRHETFLGTLVPVYIEMDHFQKSLWRLMRPRVLSRQMNGTLREIATPKGVVVIYAPSNFPIMLAIRPLAAAIAAGNCVLLKASEHAPACERFLMRLRDVLDKDSFAVVTGDAKIAQRISSLAWDHVMFTGSAAVGKLVMKAAAEHLTPITLELGGKSPAVVTASADIPTTARSIAQSRFINAGQVCLSTVRSHYFKNILTSCRSSATTTTLIRIRHESSSKSSYPLFFLINMYYPYFSFIFIIESSGLLLD